MFDTFNGLPLHALVVHAAVVLVPLSGLLGVLFAVPRTRAWSRWPLPVVSVLALGSTFVATRSGAVLERALGLDAATGENPAAALVERHSELGDQLLYLMLAYAVVAVAASALAGRRTTPARTAGEDAAGEDAAGERGSGGRPVAMGLSMLLVVGAVLISTWTYRVGDLGARAVWDPADNIDYSDPG